MLSIVLRFEPTYDIPSDPLGLANAKPDFPSECSQAAPLPGKVAKIVDIDQPLQASDTLYQLFLDKSATLLEKARYDRRAYLTWAEDIRIKQHGEQSN
jgi:hypothetical protein